MDSAGTIDMHTGNPPDKRIRQTAAARNIPIDGAARQIKAADLNEFDLILTMDFENRAYVDRLKTKFGGTAEIRNFCDLCTKHDLNEVPDPYYGGQEGFELVLDLLEDGCSNLLTEVQGKQNQ